MTKIVLKKLTYVTATALLVVSFFSFMSFNYFYLYAHINSISDFIFCILQWIKLTGLAVVVAAVLFNSKRFKIVLKYLYSFLPLLSLFWIKRYTSLESTPITEEEYIYHKINNFMPSFLIKAFFIAEAILMSLTAVLTQLKDGLKIKTEIKSLKLFLPVFILLMPLNLPSNFTAMFSTSVHNFLYFRNFSIWHFASFMMLCITVATLYNFLKNKNSVVRRQYLLMLTVILIIQYMSRASLLIGDGYNTYKTLYSFLPLFVCNIGVFVVCAAIFTRNKHLYNISFFVHAPGAFSVFVYFGKESMSNFGTIFDYTFLYFVYTHIILFSLCVLPIMLNEHRFKIKNCVSSLVYFSVFLIIASSVGQIISSIDFTYGSTSLNIYPNFAFTQISPIEISTPQIIIKIFNLKFDILYLLILYIVHMTIFFAFYFLYHFLLESKMLPQKILESENLSPV